MYDQDLAPNVTHKSLVLGGEFAMWLEIADSHVVEAKVWPRAAAFAERAWSNPTTSWKDAIARMCIQRDRIAESGIGADAIQPAWCRQHLNDCSLS
ncbi:Aste57867_16919 [Aphanomyces stellatus]|uniref:beta-N-acetylhexosaminidase n=1 Tax=Aphanomyces stellatus TaxID=120398 RepID=A0A485L7G9_9STRA|nr:hypothetical protein As57867_016861 [Aphanomyces stellatus]VFT93681.1 Aste57867_16919 [Aphanomyces stellatus]